MTWPFDRLQRGAYGVILADPPTHFRQWSAKGYGKSASQHYSLMSLDAIKALPVAELAAPDSFLWLWATQAQLNQALSVMESWPFAVGLDLGPTASPDKEELSGTTQNVAGTEMPVRAGRASLRPRTGSLELEAPGLHH